MDADDGPVRERAPLPDFALVADDGRRGRRRVGARARHGLVREPALRRGVHQRDAVLLRMALPRSGLVGRRDSGRRQREAERDHQPESGAALARARAHLRCPSTESSEGHVVQEAKDAHVTLLHTGG